MNLVARDAAPPVISFALAFVLLDVFPVFACLLVLGLGAASGLAIWRGRPKARPMMLLFGGSLVAVIAFAALVAIEHIH